MLSKYKLDKEKLICLYLWVYKVNLQIGTSTVEDLPILWNEIDLWEPIEMEKIFREKLFLFSKSKSIDFFFY